MQGRAGAERRTQRLNAAPRPGRRSCRDAERLQTLSGLSADSRDQPARRSAKRAHACSRVSTTKPRASRRRRRPSPRACSARCRPRRVSPVSLLDLGDDPSHAGLRRRQPGELEIDLVEPHHLDRLDVAADRPPSPRPRRPGNSGSPAAARPPAGTAPRLRGRDRRAHPEPARLVGGRGHDRSRPASGDDHRQPRSSGRRRSSTDT